MVLVALAPKDPKAGAGTVEGVVCWGVPKLNCIFGVSKGVVAGAATFEDPKEKTPPAGVVDVGTTVVGALKPNPPLLAGMEVSLGNWYGGADGPKLNGAVEVCGVPNEKALDGAVAVVGVAPTPEPNEKIELELVGTDDPTVDPVMDEVVGKTKLLGAAVAVGTPNVVGAVVAVCKPNVGREVVVVDKPKTVGAVVAVGKPKLVIAGVEVVVPKGGITDVTVGTPKVGAGAVTVEDGPPNTVEPPKLKDDAVEGLNNEEVEVGPPVKLNEAAVVAAGGLIELLEVSDSFSVAAPKSNVDFSVDAPVLTNENEGFVCSVAPNEKADVEPIGICFKSDGAAVFFPRISITLPVSNKGTLESGTEDAVPKLTMGLGLEAEVVVVEATLNPVAAGLNGAGILNSGSASVFFL